MRRARHEARQGRDHPRYPERRRRGPQGPRRDGHHPHRRRSQARRHPGRQDHAQRRDSAFSRRETLRAIFGEKAGDVRDSSLRVPPGVFGTVINAKVFSRKGIEKDERAKQIESTRRGKLLKDQSDEIKIMRDSDYSSIRKLLGSARSTGKLVDGRANPPEKGKSSPRAPVDSSPTITGRQISVGEELEGSSSASWNLEETTEAVEARSARRSAASRRAMSCLRASSRWSRSTSPSSASCRWATRWPAATATRVSSRA